MGAIVCVCKYCISKPYPLLALCIFFPAARNQGPPPHPPGTVGHKRHPGHFATTLLQLCYNLWYHLTPRGPQDTMLQLCYNFATTYATTWPQEAPSFNRELSPKSRLKKHPLDGDFLRFGEMSHHRNLQNISKSLYLLRLREP